VKAEIKILAEKYQKVQSVMRFVNEESLREAYEQQSDSDVKRKYGKYLAANINELLRRMKVFSYFPQSQDWFQVTSMGGNGDKYILRTFEDRMLQYLFGEILEAIFEPKICRMMVELKKKGSITVSHHRFLIAAAVIEIDVVQLLRHIDQDCLVDFLKHNVADKNFIRFCERFLNSGVKLLGECVDLKSESAVCFLSMMRSICECYVLQLLSSTLKDDCGGAMWVVSNDKSVKFMFEKSVSCKHAYRQLCYEMRKIGLDPIEDKICFWELTSQRKKQRVPHRNPLASANHLNCNLICRGKIRRDREGRKKNEDFY